MNAWYGCTSYSLPSNFAIGTEKQQFCAHKKKYFHFVFLYANSCSCDANRNMLLQLMCIFVYVLSCLSMLLLLHNFQIYNIIPFSVNSFFFFFFSILFIYIFPINCICISFLVSFYFYLFLQGKQRRSKHWYDYVQNFLLCSLEKEMLPNMHGRKYKIVLILNIQYWHQKLDATKNNIILKCSAVCVCFVLFVCMCVWNYYFDRFFNWYDKVLLLLEIATHTHTHRQPNFLFNHTCSLQAGIIHTRTCIACIYSLYIPTCTCADIRLHQFYNLHVYIMCVQNSSNKIIVRINSRNGYSR